NARNGGKNSLNRLIRCVCGKKIGPDPRNFNQRVSLGRNDLLIRTFPNDACRFKTYSPACPTASSTGVVGLVAVFAVLAGSGHLLGHYEQ
ncbi:hypothetical protein ACQ4OF_08730, partial [Klebsiella pneumoniae]